MKLVFASDHGGRELRMFLQQKARELGHEVLDMGTNDDASVDYPDYAKLGCDALLAGKAERCILVCGTGIGISIAANKIKGIRCALCSTEYDARMTRKHNDANTLALGGRTLGQELALAIFQTFVETGFEGGRHAVRVEKIAKLEK